MKSFPAIESWNQIITDSFETFGFHLFTTMDEQPFHHQKGRMAVHKTLSGLNYRTTFKMTWSPPLLGYYSLILHFLMLRTKIFQKISLNQTIEYYLESLPLVMVGRNNMIQHNLAWLEVTKTVRVHSISNIREQHPLLKQREVTHWKVLIFVKSVFCAQWKTELQNRNYRNNCYTKATPQTIERGPTKGKLVIKNFWKVLIVNK